MTEKELAEIAACLPEHLRFFFVKPPPGLEPGELLQFMEERETQVRKHREELIARGIDADLFLAQTEPKFRELKTCQAKVEKAEDDLLTAQADSADARYKLFRTCQEALRAAEEEKPFDPQVQEFREQLDKWAKHFPKE